MPGAGLPAIVISLKPSPMVCPRSFYVLSSMLASAGSSDGVFKSPPGEQGGSRKQNLQRFWERIRPNCEALSPGGRLLPS